MIYLLFIFFLVELDLELSTVSLFNFGLIILIFTMSFILIFKSRLVLIFKSRLVFINSVNVFLLVKSIFSILSVIISSVFDLKNIILLLLSKLISNSEIFLGICAGSTLIESEFFT